MFTIIADHKCIEKLKVHITTEDSLDMTIPYCVWRNLKYFMCVQVYAVAVSNIFIVSSTLEDLVELWEVFKS